MSHKQRIGLLGGTFDPIHIGHLVVAESVLTNLQMQLIYFIPAFKHAIKSNEKITAPDTRLELLKIALEKYPYFKMSKIELERNEISYTVDTLRYFKKYENLPEAELFYIIGKDNLSEMHLWKNPEEILQLATLVVLQRPHTKDTTNFSKIYTEKIVTPETPLIDISSTMIRQRIKEQKPWKSLVPPEVYDFIMKHQLYLSI